VQSPEAVATAIGRNVRRLRNRRALTLDGLAAAAGVSRSTVIQIEAGKANPSVGTLLALASVLRVGIGSLVDVDAGPEMVVRRRATAAQLWRTDAGSSAVFLLGTDPPDVIELWDWTLQPGEGFHSEAHPAGTREVLSVLSGTLRMRVGDAQEVMGTGDTVMFPAHAAHHYSCAGDEPVRFMMFALEPDGVTYTPPTSIAPAGDAESQDAGSAAGSTGA
jgi:transcriptional regulator with XRE-family HTH domain